MKKVFRKIFISLICILINTNSFAKSDVEYSPEKISVQFESELKLKMEFTHIMLKVGNDIDQQLDKDLKNNENIFDEPEKLTNLLKTEIAIYRDHYEKTLNLPNDQIAPFRNVFNHLDWEKIIPIFKKAHLGIEVLLKKKGFGIGIAIMAGVLCEYLVPITLIHLGLAKFIPLSMMTPWASIYSFAPGMFQNIKTNFLLEKELGSKENLKLYRQQIEEINKLLLQSGPEDIILPISDFGSKTNNVVIHQEIWWKNVLTSFGYDSNYLNYNSLNKFIKDNQIESGYISWVQDNKSLDKNSKIALIVHYLYSMNDPIIEDNFNKKFNSQFITLENSSHWNEIWNWTKTMREIRNIDDLKKGIELLPEDASPKEIASIWENILLPEYIKNLDLNFSEARTMINQFEVLKAKLILMPDDGIDEKSRSEIYIYLKKIIEGKKFTGCKNSPSNIAAFLMKKAL